MRIYRIRFATGGHRIAYTGLFADGIEAVLQTMADWPDARGISAVCLSRRAAT